VALQVDDGVWTEVKNFMKCLIQMFMARVRGAGVDGCLVRFTGLVMLVV
jgi:hypothetical protein